MPGQDPAEYRYNEYTCYKICYKKILSHFLFTCHSETLKKIDRTILIGLSIIFPIVIPDCRIRWSISLCDSGHGFDQALKNQPRKKDPTCKLLIKHSISFSKKNSILVSLRRVGPRWVRFAAFLDACSRDKWIVGMALASQIETQIHPVFRVINFAINFATNPTLSATTVKILL